MKSIGQDGVDMGLGFLRRGLLPGCLGILFFLPDPTLAAGDSGGYDPGVNMWGRPGLAVSSTFERFAPGTWILSSHYVFESFASGDNLSLIPFGVTYMASENLVVYGNDSYQLNRAGQGLSSLVLGCKLGFRVEDPAWQFSLGGDMATGPLSGSLGAASTDWIPAGTVAYVFGNGLLFNFSLGAYLPGNGLPSYLRFDPGFAYSFSPGWTATLELTGHHSQETPFNPGSSVVLGVRGNGPLHLQGFFGLGSSGDAPSYYGGFSILLASSMFEGFI